MALGKLCLLLLTLAFFSMGLVVIFSTTSAEVLDLGLEKATYHSVLRQFFYGLTGFSLGVLLWKAGYRRLLAAAPFLYWFFIILLAATLIPGIGREVNGAKRWLVIGGITFQPSEFVKYILPLYLVALYKRISEPEKMTFKQFRPLAAASLVPIVLVAIEPNNGTAAVIGVAVTALFFLMRIPYRYWVAPLACCLLAGGAFAYNMPYVAARLKVYWNPELDIRGKGHQPYQAKIAAGSGRLLGKGPGKSWQKLSYLPEAQNDYIAAIFAEEYGFVGCLTLLAAYMAFATFGVSIANRSIDFSGFMIAGTYTFLISFQAFLNLAVVSGMLPSTGMNLPFFSQGGTSLMANLLAVAIMLSIQLQRAGEKSLSAV